MSTPYNPYGPPKTTPVGPKPTQGPTNKPKFGPENRPIDVIESLDYKNIVYDGVSMSIGIIGASYVVKKVNKNYAPQNLNSKSIFTLSFVTILTRAVIEFLGREGYFSIGL